MQTLFILQPVAQIELSFIPKIAYHSKALNSSAEVAHFLKSVFNEHTLNYSEDFYALYLNRSFAVQAFAHISKGSISGTVVDIRTILAIALSCGSSAIIITHNHPSGSLKPSKQDIDLTKKIKDAAKLMDINLIDHIIITNDAYTSFADEGLL